MTEHFTQARGYHELLSEVARLTKENTRLKLACDKFSEAELLAQPAHPVNAEIERVKALYENSTAAHEETVGRAMKAEKELASIKAQEPVGYILPTTGKFVHASTIAAGHAGAHWEKLYAAPAAPQQEQKGGAL